MAFPLHLNPHEMLLFKLSIVQHILVCYFKREAFFKRRMTFCHEHNESQIEINNVCMLLRALKRELPTMYMMNLKPPDPCFRKLNTFLPMLSFYTNGIHENTFVPKLLFHKKNTYITALSINGWNIYKSILPQQRTFISRCRSRPQLPPAFASQAYFWFKKCSAFYFILS